MKQKPKSRKQKGIALLMAIFALMLISAIGIGLLFSTDTETRISANYRDKQVATFAALAGLQEARTRIHPLNGDLRTLVPKTLPPVTAPGGTTNKLVLYIINPSDGETVAPWDPSNPYFDNELCQENVLGVAGPPGVACTTYPSAGSAQPSWVEVWNNSTQDTNPDGTANIWQKDAPLAYKWVRVMLKSNVMTPLHIPDATGGTTSTGKALCFDGLHQAVSTTGCGPKTKSVLSVAVQDGGSGYDINNPPGVTFSSGDAEARAVVSAVPSGSVTGLSLDNTGSGYTTPPTVTIAPPASGTQATAVAVLQGKPVNSVSVTNANPAACYPAGTVPQVSFDSKYGSGATAVANMTTTACIASFSATAACGKSYKNKTYNVTTSTGGFAGTITFDGSGNVSNTSGIVSNPGSYTSMPATASGLCSGATFKFNPGVHIASVTVKTGGEYSQPPTTTFTSAFFVGTASTAASSLGGVGGQLGQLKSLTLVNGGSGYTTVPAVSFSGGGGSGAAATASLTTTNKVTSIIVTNPGHDYTSAPSVSIAAPPSGGLTAKAVASIGYLNGGAGSNATAQGSVYLLTAMAETKTKARSVAQMEVAVSYYNFTPPLGGALTMVGPSPIFGTPNANKFFVSGQDANSCGETAYNSKPAIGAWGPDAVTAVKAVLGKPDNYIGAKDPPDIENVYSNQLTSKALNDFVQSAISAAQADPVHGHVYTTDPGNDIYLGNCSTNNFAIDVVQGDFTMGPQTGCGILVVTGKLTISGNYGWNGLIFVIGDGASLMNGGGTGQINGAVYVANTSENTLGQPSADWSGGGGNGVIYDHCYADNLMGLIPSSPQPVPDSLRVLSTRMLEY